MALADELGLNGSVKFFDPLSLRAIARVVADADLGVVPKRADSFGNDAYSTKIMEFMSLGVPVVVSGTRVDRYYFDESVVRFFESGNDEELARAMYEVLTNSELRESMVRNANEYVGRQSWGRHKSGYLQLVDALIAGTPIRNKA
jgi:glycosyltransferase involved in cell wall biosynthesis